MDFAVLAGFMGGNHAFQEFGAVRRPIHEHHFFPLVAETTNHAARQYNLPMDLEFALQKLLVDLEPLKGARRKCRRHELFLFAAQKKLYREDLIRKRSSLVPGVVTGPPHLSLLPILESHNGSEAAMERPSDQETGRISRAIPAATPFLLGLKSFQLIKK